MSLFRKEPIDGLLDIVCRAAQRRLARHGVPILFDTSGDDALWAHYDFGDDLTDVEIAFVEGEISAACNGRATFPLFQPFRFHLAPKASRAGNRVAGTQSPLVFLCATDTVCRKTAEPDPLETHLRSQPEWLNRIGTYRDRSDVHEPG